MAELAILFKLNDYIGFFSTIGIVIFTGTLGAYLAKSQGKEILYKMQNEMQGGRLPGDQIINGLCVLVGGAMLLTPGIITDIAGFILVIPVTRELIKVFIKKKLQKMIDEGKVNFYFRG